MTPEQAMVWGILRGQRGRARAVKQADLARACGVSVRVLQRILKELAEDHDKPIVSTCRAPQGVFVPITEEEKEEYLGQLRARVSSLLRRAKAVSGQRAREMHREVQRDLWDDRKAS